MRRFAAALLLPVVVASPAFAQPGPAPVPAPAAGTELPPPPPVQDPMLTPVPTPKRVIATWEEALTFLRSRSTDLRIAYDEVRRAEAQTRSALAALLPSLTANGTATHQFLVDTTTDPLTRTTRTSPNPTQLDGNLIFSAPLVNLQALDAYKISKINTDAFKWSVEDTKRILALNVANAIVGVVTAERVAELNRVGLRQALERLDLTKRKQALGAATGLDVVRAQQDVESARATLVNGDESLRQAREALGLALGVPEQVGVSPSANMQGLEQSALAVCRVAPSIDDRPDVAAARVRLEIAKRNVKNVYYQFAPTLTARSTLASSYAVEGITFPPATTWNIQGILSIPIWEGGARYGALRQARAVEDEALMNLEALRRTASIQIEQARRGVEVAEQSRRVAAAARDLAADLDRLTQIAYRNGQGTSLELVVAAAGLRQAEINLALQDFGVVKARILAYMALATCPW